MCARAEEIWRLRCSRDIDGLIDAIADPDPWIRRYAFWMVQRYTDYTAVRREIAFGGLRLTEGEDGVREQIASLRESLQRHNRKIQSKMSSRPSDPKSLHGSVKLSSMYSFIGYLNREELGKGNRDAAHPLVALLDDEHIRVRSHALMVLIGRTGFPHTTEEVWRLHFSRKPDPEFEADIRARFLVWWAANKETYKPKVAKPPEPR